MLQRSRTAASGPADGPVSPFTRVLGGQRQRSRRFRTPVRPAAVLTSAPTYGTHPPSCTRYNPVKPYTQRRQRSKRFRPRGHAASRAELSPTLLLPVESHAPSPQCTAAVSPTPANTRAEPPLLPAESAALSSQGPGLPPPLVAPLAACLAGLHPAQAPHLLLPHTSGFPGVFFPPSRPNADARSNAVSRTVTYDAPRASTRLQRDAWAFFLSDYPDRDFVDTLLHIIDYGANIAFLGDRTSPQTSACSD